jgi:DNA-directed RNA polymerase subunit RPC12/RpoP
MTVDVASVPSEVVERVVAKYVRLWSCGTCGEERYRITDAASGTGRSCPECDNRMTVEIDPSTVPSQPSL